MAKIHKNADKFPIQWDGDVVQFEGDKKMITFHQK